MAKITFSVTVIRQGRENDFRDFWDNGVLINHAGEKLHSGLLSFSETIEAKNLNEAISLVQKKHVGLTIARNYSSKVG